MDNNNLTDTEILNDLQWGEESTGFLIYGGFMKKHIIMICIVLLIIVLYFSFIDKKNTLLENNTIFQEIVDENNNIYYQIYNNGHFIKNVTRKEDVQVYLDNPEFKGPEHEEDEAFIFEESKEENK